MAKVSVEEVVVKTVKLELTMNEAEVLAALLGQCRCSGLTSPVYDALDEAGVDSYKYKVNIDKDFYVISVVEV